MHVTHTLLLSLLLLLLFVLCPEVANSMFGSMAESLGDDLLPPESKCALQLSHALLGYHSLQTRHTALPVM
mgnify:CR=1 FL=1